jgi:uncharacterized protein YidB (DUF937 family)
MALFNILGGGSNRGGMSPLMMALVGVLAYRTLHGKGRLAEMLGMNHPAGAPGAATPGQPAGTANEPSGGLGGMLGGLGGGGLGGLLGGVLGGGALSGGLQDLLNQFHQNGQGDKANSWVSGGANTPVSASELEQALGGDRIDWLVHQTGMPRDQLLTELSGALPGVVDKLTPNGRVPTEQEAAAMHTGG